jgi:hypothetical protein
LESQSFPIAVVKVLLIRYLLSLNPFHSFNHFAVIEITVGFQYLDFRVVVDSIAIIADQTLVRIVA